MLKFPVPILDKWHRADELAKIKIDSIGAVGRFGKCETEVAAGQLVAFFQRRNLGWAPFYLSEIGPIDNSLHGLLGSWIDDGDFGIRPDPGFLVRVSAHKWAVTEKFVDFCGRER